MRPARRTGGAARQDGNENEDGGWRMENGKDRSANTAAGQDGVSGEKLKLGKLKLGNPDFCFLFSPFLLFPSPSATPFQSKLIQVNPS